MMIRKQIPHERIRAAAGEKPNDWTDEIFRLIFKNRHKGMS